MYYITLIIRSVDIPPYLHFLQVWLSSSYIMFQTLPVVSYAVAVGFFPAALALPQMHLMPNIGNGGEIGGVLPSPTTTATATSGYLYGPTSLLGEIATPASNNPSAQVGNYELVNGQEADSDLGLYLDFNSAENPQPLRGDGGQTDPGPRRSNLDDICQGDQG